MLPRRRCRHANLPQIQHRTYQARLPSVRLPTPAQAALRLNARSGPLPKLVRPPRSSYLSSSTPHSRYTTAPAPAAGPSIDCRADSCCASCRPRGPAGLSTSTRQTERRHTQNNVPRSSGCWGGFGAEDSDPVDAGPRGGGGAGVSGRARRLARRYTCGGQRERSAFGCAARGRGAADGEGSERSVRWSSLIGLATGRRRDVVRRIVERLLFSFCYCSTGMVIMATSPVPQRLMRKPPGGLELGLDSGLWTPRTRSMLCAARPRRATCGRLWSLQSAA